MSEYTWEVGENGIVAKSTLSDKNGVVEIHVMTEQSAPRWFRVYTSRRRRFWRWLRGLFA